MFGEAFRFFIMFKNLLPTSGLHRRLTLTYTLVTCGMFLVFWGSIGMILVFEETVLSERLAALAGFLLVTLMILLFVALLGTLFGLVASRGLVTRLQNLDQSVALWANGNLDKLVEDNEDDEIGQLSRNLNQMVLQLNRLMQERTTLATMEERNRLARDLHDSVKQQIFSLSMQLSSAKILADTQPTKLPAVLDQMEGLVERVQTELNDLIHALRPSVLEEEGFLPALRQQLDSWANNHQVHVTTQIDPTIKLPLQMSHALYRLVQEALANISKHAHATQVEVRFYQDDMIRLAIIDDGRGFRVDEQVDGFGLHTMQERLYPFGGKVHVQSVVGQGTAVQASLPPF